MSYDSHRKYIEQEACQTYMQENLSFLPSQIVRAHLFSRVVLLLEQSLSALFRLYVDLDEDYRTMLDFFALKKIAKAKL